MPGLFPVLSFAFRRKVEEMKSLRDKAKNSAPAEGSVPLDGDPHITELADKSRIFKYERDVGFNSDCHFL